MPESSVANQSVHDCSYEVTGIVVVVAAVIVVVVIVFVVVKAATIFL